MVLRCQLDCLLVGCACLIKLILVCICLGLAVESFRVGRVHLDGLVGSFDRLLILLLFGVAEGQVCVKNCEGLKSMLHPLLTELLKLQLRDAREDLHTPVVEDVGPRVLPELNKLPTKTSNFLEVLRSYLIGCCLRALRVSLNLTNLNSQPYRTSNLSLTIHVRLLKELVDVVASIVPLLTDF